VSGFYHTDYLGYQHPRNPSYINRLKNDKHHATLTSLQKDADIVSEILMEELPIIADKAYLNRPVACVMPRAKPVSTYTPDQLLFSHAVSEALDDIKGIKNGTRWISRMKPTQTTHLQHSAYYFDAGISPYVGITKDTCIISPKVKGRDIILVDDVYTYDVNVIEDSLQALLDAGARKVVSYVLSKTKSYQ
jgi:hypothetical protein